MTNGEKYKTASERKDAYKRYANKHWKIADGFLWLEMEAEEELLPCPFCGNESVLVHKTIGTDLWYVSCDDCDVRTKGSTSKDKAIAAWNSRMKGETK